MTNYPGGSRDWGAFLDRAPQSDDWEQELKERPESYYVPFSEQFRDIAGKFRDPPSSADAISSSFRQLNQLPESNAALYAPPVATGGSIEWSGDRKPGPSRVSVDGTALPGSPVKKKRATSTKKGDAKPKKQKKSKGGIDVKDGSIVYVRAETWSKYKKKWPYPQHIELEYAYFKG